MRAALRGRHGVAVGMNKAVALIEPGAGPFDTAGAVPVRGLRQHRIAGPYFGNRARRVGDVLPQAVAQATREMQYCLGRRVRIAAQKSGRAGPADLDAAEQIGFRPAQFVQDARAELQRMENLRIRLETDRGAAPVMNGPGVLQFRRRLAARETLLVQGFLARHFDFQDLGQRVHHRTADAVQPAGRIVGLARKLAAGMQRSEDHLQRGQLGKFRVRIDGNAAPVVPHRQEIAGLERDLDKAGVAGNRFVHRIVEDFGGEVVQRRLVGAADIHAGPAAHRLQPLQYLDVLGGVGVGATRAGITEEIVHPVFPWKGAQASRRCVGGAREGRPWGAAPCTQPKDKSLDASN